MSPPTHLAALLAGGHLHASLQTLGSSCHGHPVSADTRIPLKKSRSGLGKVVIFLHAAAPLRSSDLQTRGTHHTPGLTEHLPRAGTALGTRD